MLSDGITALYSRVKIIEIFRNNLEEFGINITEEELTEIFDIVSEEFYKEIDKYTKPIDSAIKFIKKLRSFDVKIGIVTSDSIDSTNLTIKNFGWENLFDVVIGRESTKETKESGIPTKLALEKLNSNPENTAMIGDAPMDYISAKNAGINRTILVATGQLTCEELHKTSEYVLKSLGELECSKI
jgi:HAD superfamily hydrolase (TIGR01549 family)